MNIAVINISLRPWMETTHYPIGLAYVATALYGAGYDFDIIDIGAHRHSEEELKRLLSAKGYDVVAFGTLVSGYRYAKCTAEIARRANPDATIVAGNSVASSIPEHLLRNTEVDVAVKGEGEITFLNLLSALEKATPLANVKGIAFLHDGEIIDTGYEEPIADANKIPLPRWDLFDIDVYLRRSHLLVPRPYPIPPEQIRNIWVNSARGCPFHCTFCYHVFQYTRYRRRSTESIVSEIRTWQQRYSINSVSFADELSFPNKRSLGELVDLVLENRLEFCWMGDCRSDLATEDDIDLLRRAREAGCVGFGYSLESADAGILKAMNKKLSLDDFKRLKLALDRAGIKTYTSLVIGYPQETLETLKKTFDVCYELDIYPSVGYLLPQPGTPMFEIAKQKGYVSDMETYLCNMGDRQDLRFNLTSVPDDVLQEAVADHLQRISDKLGLGLEKERLIKTGSYVTAARAATGYREHADEQDAS